MSLGEAFDFELFNLKDIWRKIKKDPERLFIGAADPWSSKAWGKILGKDYEPMVDQLGAPYGGHTISAFGKQEGGVYERARQSGIDTGTAEGLHDAAHVVSALYGGAGLGNAFGNAFGSFGGGGQLGSGGAQPGLWNQAFSGSRGFSGAPYGANPAQGIGGIAGPIGGGSAGGASGLSTMDYAKLGMQAMNAQPQQAQPMQPMMPPQRKPQYPTRVINGHRYVQIDGRWYMEH